MILFKLGGRVLEKLLEADCPLTGWNRIEEPFVVVHGGGAVINETAKALGVSSEFVAGQRVTSPEMVDVVEMVLRGRMNPSLVRVLEKEGLKAWGLCASDMKILDCDLEDPALGLVGRVRAVNKEPLCLLLENNYVPVLAPLGSFKSATRQVVNVNADMAAAQVARALPARKLVFFTDRDGILDAKERRVPSLTFEELKSMREGTSIQGGMLVKTRGVLEFLESQKDAEVWVLNGLRPIELDTFIASGSSEFGTKITSR
jgi:acetylglutamate kinase